MNEEQEKALQELSDLSQVMEDQKLRFESKLDDWWNNLPRHEREWAFYSVCKRIYQGEIVDKGSYRYVLYDILGFDGGMYAHGMDCGYMALHNVIGDGVEYNAMRRVNRLEVIDGTGRICVRYLKDDEKVRYELQDDDRTLKVFIDEANKWMVE